MEIKEIKSKLKRFYKWQYFWLFLIILATLIMHLCIITNPIGPIFDEIHYVKDARSITENQTTERLEHPPLELGLVKGALFADEYVHFEHGFQVDHVKAAAASDGVTNHLGVGVKGVTQGARQWLDVLQAQVRNQVNVHRRPDDAVHGAGQGASDKVGDVQ